MCLEMLAGCFADRGPNSLRSLNYVCGQMGKVETLTVSNSFWMFRQRVWNWNSLLFILITSSGTMFTFSLTHPETLLSLWDLCAIFLELPFHCPLKICNLFLIVSYIYFPFRFDLVCSDRNNRDFITVLKYAGETLAFRTDVECKILFPQLEMSVEKVLPLTRIPNQITSKCGLDRIRKSMFSQRPPVS